MRASFIILTVCAFAAAMVPMERRAMNPDEMPPQSSSTTSTTAKPKEICAPETPCAWSTYRNIVKIIEYNVTNTYCVCSADTECQINEDDRAINTFIYRCRPPTTSDDEEEEES